MVDTPGFADTNMSDTEVLGRISSWMASRYTEGALLSGIVYLHPITHNRMDGPSTTNIRMFRKLCGDKTMRNVILATTMWPTPEQGTDDLLEGRAKDLEREFWSEMIDNGSKIHRFDNTKESASKIISELIDKRPRKLNIQEELVDKHLSLEQTEAGACVDAELQRLRREHEEELEAIRSDMQDMQLGECHLTSWPVRPLLTLDRQ